MSGVLLRAEGLEKVYAIGSHVVRALDGVDLALPKGSTVAVVGESGSGKTTLGNLLLGLEPPSAGRIWYQDRPLGHHRAPKLRRGIQVVQQNPYSALNPQRTVQHAVELPLIVHGFGRRRRRLRRVAELLEVVGLGSEYMTRFPASLSGGQRQRVALARALAAEPEVIILDEPTSALDVSVQAKILALLGGLQRRMGLTYLFITHDLAIVRNIADRVVVLYRGRVVEDGATEAVFSAPRHRYTAMLLSSIPVISPEDEALKPHWPWDRAALDGHAHASSGCAFAPRCPFAEDDCWNRVPPLTRPTQHAHAHACLHPRQEDSAQSEHQG